MAGWQIAEIRLLVGLSAGRSAPNPCNDSTHDRGGDAADQNSVAKETFDAFNNRTPAGRCTGDLSVYAGRARILDGGDGHGVISGY